LSRNRRLSAAFQEARRLALYHDGDFDMSASEGLFALKMIGDSPDAPYAPRAEAIIARGGAFL
jgi:hypothetical protein